MAIFLSVFLSLYGSLHFYAFWKAKRAFGFNRRIAVSIAFLMGVMVITPILVRVLEQQGLASFARILAYAGYTWMGFLFLFIAAGLALDILGGIVYLISRVQCGSVGKWRLSPRVSFFIALGACFVGGVYALVEATAVRTEHIVIESPKIPASLGRIRVVQISDVHLGLIIGKQHLSRILDAVRAAKPDILVSTGDLLDGQPDGIAGLETQFREMKPRFGKYAVNGNHEYYVGVGIAEKFCQEAGFTLLSNERVDIPGAVILVGLDDPSARRFRISEGFTEKELLMGLPKERFVILLKHRPVLNPETRGLFDLQLSGHSHRGQIFPFTLIIQMLYPIASGLLDLENDSYLYVNPGSGTWGPPMRFLAPPEVTVIDLVHGKSEKS